MSRINWEDWASMTSAERAVLGLPHIRIKVVRSREACATCELAGESGYLLRRDRLGVFIVLLDRDLDQGEFENPHSASEIEILP